MALLVSSWSTNVESLPESYVMPPERRPGNFVTICEEIPVIDLGSADEADLVRKIINACQEFGLFQVINHGVPEKVMQDAREIYKEFFGMSVEDKASMFSLEVSNRSTLYTSGLNYAKEVTHYWKDTLKHPVHPLEEHQKSWPEKPARYRDEIGRYSIEVRTLGLRILDLIGKGLGLNEGYFDGELSQSQGMAINHYPPCPDPNLAMGIGSHTDPNLLTLLQQDEYGLQIFNRGQWVGVEPLPNAFVVNSGYQLQVISNGKLKSAEHRGVTNSRAARTSIVTFFVPSRSRTIEPAKELVTSIDPQRFKPYVYQEFLDEYLAYVAKPIPRAGTPLDPYKL